MTTRPAPSSSAMVRKAELVSCGHARPSGLDLDVPNHKRCIADLTMNEFLQVVFIKW